MPAAALATAIAPSIAAAVDSADHPRVATDAREDVLFLKLQLAAAAAASLSETGSAPAAISPWIDAFVEEIFRLAAPNITVNGIPYDDAFRTTQEFEPFDDGLRATVDDLLVTTTSLQSRVAGLRTTLPVQLAEAEKKRLDSLLSSSEPAVDTVTDSSVVAQEQCIRHLGLLIV
ncbi:hypothetical protein HK405_005769 [Cladochytrium tenue]|nr:hypothetical protein HK405_005769 [Cladochytrium tenue]